MHTTESFLFINLKLSICHSSHHKSYLLGLCQVLEEGVAARQDDGEAGRLELSPQRLRRAALPVLLDVSLGGEREVVVEELAEHGRHQRRAAARNVEVRVHRRAHQPRVRQEA